MDRAIGKAVALPGISGFCAVAAAERHDLVSGANDLRIAEFSPTTVHEVAYIFGPRGKTSR